MNLTAINKEDLIFSGDMEDDRTNTYLILNDYDWMNYILKTRFHTKDLGVLYVEFEYYGATDSSMKVEQNINGVVETVVYTYPTDIFQKYIIRFLANHIAQWGDKYAFNGEDEVVDFYNEVIEKGRIFED